MFYIVFLKNYSYLCNQKMGFGSKCNILNGQVIYIEKNQNWILATCDSFPLIMSQILCTIFYLGCKNKTQLCGKINKLTSKWRGNMSNSSKSIPFYPFQWLSHHVVRTHARMEDSVSRLLGNVQPTLAHALKGMEASNVKRVSIECTGWVKKCNSN